ncbi:hypothetical protein CRUP_009669 [Coryphaenoides rupestris]|nr:hypothetical protein CRUP_009669 [Coryphaenoides rupestris]
MLAGPGLAPHRIVLCRLNLDPHKEKGGGGGDGANLRLMERTMSPTISPTGIPHQAKLRSEPAGGLWRHVTRKHLWLTSSPGPLRESPSVVRNQGFLEEGELLLCSSNNDGFRGSFWRDAEREEVVNPAPDACWSQAEEDGMAGKQREDAVKYQETTQHGGGGGVGGGGGGGEEVEEKDDLKAGPSGFCECRWFSYVLGAPHEHSPRDEDLYWDETRADLQELLGHNDEVKMRSAPHATPPHATATPPTRRRHPAPPHATPPPRRHPTPPPRHATPHATPTPPPAREYIYKLWQCPGVRGPSGMTRSPHAAPPHAARRTPLPRARRQSDGPATRVPAVKHTNLSTKIWVKVAMAIAYFLCVSVAAFILVVYYVFFWTPDAHHNVTGNAGADAPNRTDCTQGQSGGRGAAAAHKDTDDDEEEEEEEEEDHIEFLQVCACLVPVEVPHLWESVHAERPERMRTTGTRRTGPGPAWAEPQQRSPESIVVAATEQQLSFLQKALVPDHAGALHAAVQGWRRRLAAAGHQCTSVSGPRGQPEVLPGHVSPESPGGSDLWAVQRYLLLNHRDRNLLQTSLAWWGILLEMLRDVTTIKIVEIQATTTTSSMLHHLSVTTAAVGAPLAAHSVHHCSSHITGGVAKMDDRLQATSRLAAAAAAAAAACGIE